MDRARIVIPVALALLLLGTAISGCGNNPRFGHGRALPPGTLPSSPATGVSLETESHYALAYRVAFASKHLLSVELRTQFELVIRSTIPPDRMGHSGTTRIALGPADYDITDMVISESSERVFLSSAAGWVRSYNIETQKKLSEWRMGSGVSALALSPDGAFLYIGTSSGVVCLRRLADGAQLQCMVAHKGAISALTAQGDVLVSSSYLGELSTWESVSMRHLDSLESSHSVSDIAFSDSGQELAVARNQEVPRLSDDRNNAFDQPGIHQIEIWSIRSGNFSESPKRILQGHRSVVSSVAWVGRDLISGSWDRSLKIWDTTKSGRVLTLNSFAHIVRDVAIANTSAAFSAAGWATEPKDPAIISGILLYFQ